MHSLFLQGVAAVNAMAGLSFGQVLPGLRYSIRSMTLLVSGSTRHYRLFGPVSFCVRKKRTTPLFASGQIQIAYKRLPPHSERAFVNGRVLITSLSGNATRICRSPQRFSQHIFVTARNSFPGTTTRGEGTTTATIRVIKGFAG